MLSLAECNLALPTTKGGNMFDTVLQDVVAIITLSALWFHLGRMVGIRVGYLKGRRAVREYYESRDKVRV